MNKKNNLFLVLILVIVVVGGWYWYSGKDEVYTGPVQDLTVRLGWLHQAQFAGFYAANDLGYYADRGLNVALLQLDLEKDQVEELAEGDVDVSIMEAHQLLEGIDSGHDLVAVGAVYQTNPHSLAVRSDSDIQGPEDFGGKVIGLSGGEGEGNALFRTFAKQFSGDEPVRFVNLGFDTVDDFKNNRADVIDVYRIDQPFLAEKEGIPLRVIPLDAYGFATYGDVIVVRRSMLEEQPDMVRRFVLATFEGWEEVLTNSSEGVEIALRYAEGNYKDAAYQEHILVESIPLVRGGVKQLGTMDLVQWSTLYQTMRDAGVLESEFEVRNAYTNSLLD